MSLDADAKKVLLRKIPHGLFVCGVREGDEVNGFTSKTFIISIIRVIKYFISSFLCSI